MDGSKVPWRKSPRPIQVAVICTRLILPDAVAAVKKYAIRRGSVRTICFCKCPNRTAREGQDRPCLQFRYTSAPCRQTIPTCLPKSMVVAVPTHTPAVTKPCIQFQQKRGCCPSRLHPLINYLDLYLSISNRILNSCSCSSGVFAERNS